MQSSLTELSNVNLYIQNMINSPSLFEMSNNCFLEVITVLVLYIIFNIADAV